LATPHFSFFNYITKPQKNSNCDIWPRLNLPQNPCRFDILIRMAATDSFYWHKKYFLV